MKTVTFNQNPCVSVEGMDDRCWTGWERIMDVLNHRLGARTAKRVIVTAECYPGVDEDAVLERFRADLLPDLVCHTRQCMYDPARIDEMLRVDLTGDPVFGRITQHRMKDFFDTDSLQAQTDALNSIDRGLVLIFGAGASVVHEGDLLVYLDMARWETQLRYRRNEIDNLGARNREEPASVQYKRAFFVDWRVADRVKIDLMERWDYLLDTTRMDDPKLVEGEAVREGLRQTASQPFSVTPYFDPAPWGGGWMRDRFGLEPNGSNYGWCFNCVPEENSLLLDYGGVQIEIPAVDLVFYRPLQLLGENVYSRFGAEFPIRFDFLDTMNGGNLSFQVHPLHEQIRESFSMDYTQDESYYLMDAGSDGCVYLGLKDSVDPDEMLNELRSAQQGETSFDVEKYVNKWPAKKHDHFLIPSGTVHCSGKNSMVLEISATPYIFTFKLWDWGRLGLDGKPRPIHLDHGERAIRWNRTRGWVQNQLINRIDSIAQGDGWREERTGLHELEFIETRRHWFTGAVPHSTGGTVNVLCLVEGDQIAVESPSNAFKPFIANYGEVFIMPAAVGEYIVRPAQTDPEREFATIKAFVRS
ncbi:MAG: mannose-6-phosphate isomerase [bacterium]|nr:mannose-6-phosphate isomerase [bacterium]